MLGLKGNILISKYLPRKQDDQFSPQAYTETRHGDTSTTIPVWGDRVRQILGAHWQASWVNYIGWWELLPFKRHTNLEELHLWLSSAFPRAYAYTNSFHMNSHTHKEKNEKKRITLSRNEKTSPSEFACFRLWSAEEKSQQDCLCKHRSYVGVDLNQHGHWFFYFLHRTK